MYSDRGEYTCGTGTGIVLESEKNDSGGLPVS